jgi:hypothetical protein
VQTTPIDRDSVTRIECGQQEIPCEVNNNTGCATQTCAPAATAITVDTLRCDASVRKVAADLSQSLSPAIVRHVAWRTWISQRAKAFYLDTAHLPPHRLTPRQREWRVGLNKHILTHLGMVTIRKEVRHV